MKEKNSRLVYSTATGRVKPEKEKTERPKGDGIVRIQKETKGRGGKAVSVVKGLDGDDKTLKDYTKKLKQLCGTGGTLKDGDIEIQGDQDRKSVV